METGQTVLKCFNHVSRADARKIAEGTIATIERKLLAITKRF